MPVYTHETPHDFNNLCQHNINLDVRNNQLANYIWVPNRLERYLDPGLYEMAWP